MSHRQSLHIGSDRRQQSNQVRNLSAKPHLSKQAKYSTGRYLRKKVTQVKLQTCTLPHVRLRKVDDATALTKSERQRVWLNTIEHQRQQFPLNLFQPRQW